MMTYSTLLGKAICRLVWNIDMLASAREKAEALGLKNVSFRQGDVRALPFAQDTFDLVLSLNGFHAFGNKGAAYGETASREKRHIL